MAPAFFKIDDGKGPKARPARAFEIFLTILLAGFLLFRVCSLYSSIDTVPKHVDEDYWMQSTYFYHLFFQQHDLSDPDWRNSISRDQPPIGKYILGYALNVSGRQVAQTGGGVKHWFSEGAFQPKPSDDQAMREHKRNFLEDLKNSPSATSFTPQDYRVGRVTMFACGVLAAVLLAVMVAFVLEHLFFGLLAGWIFLNNRMVIPGFQTVLIDPACYCFVLSALLMLFWLFHELSVSDRLRPKIIILSVLEGIFLSLALGTKFVAASMIATVGAVFIASILLEIIKAGKTAGKELAGRACIRVGALVLIGSSAAVLFVVTNPFLYHDTVANIQKMVQYRLTAMALSTGTQPDANKTLLEKATAVYRWGILLGYRFDNAAQKFFYGLFFIAGSAALLAKSAKELSKGVLGPFSIVLLWVTTTFVLNGFFVNMRWERYYIPFVICSCFVLSLGVQKMMKITSKTVKYFLNRPSLGK